MTPRVNLTIGQVDALRAALADQFTDDERGWLDALEGETDAFTLVSRLLDAIEAEEGTRAALTEQMDARKVRRDRCDVRIGHQRDAVIAVMRAGGLEKLPLAEATLTLREVPEKLAVNDAAAVPEKYLVPTYKPSMDAIKAEFSPDSPALPNWLRVEPSRPSLTVRRK